MLYFSYSHGQLVKCREYDLTLRYFQHSYKSNWITICNHTGRNPLWNMQRCHTDDTSLYRAEYNEATRHVVLWGSSEVTIMFGLGAFWLAVAIWSYFCDQLQAVTKNSVKCRKSLTEADNISWGKVVRKKSKLQHFITKQLLKFIDQQWRVSQDGFFLWWS